MFRVPRLAVLRRWDEMLYRLRSGLLLLSASLSEIVPRPLPVGGEGSGGEQSLGKLTAAKRLGVDARSKDGTDDK